MIRWTQEDLASMREWDRQVERDAAPKRSPKGKARAKAQKAARYRAHRAKKEEASAVRKEEPSIHIIYKAPGLPPEPREIPNTLEELQALVGGRIETVTLASDAVIICNEEGRLRHLPFNCRFLGVGFVGPLVIAGVRDDSFADLPECCTELLLDALRSVM